MVAAFAVGLIALCALFAGLISSLSTNSSRLLSGCRIRTRIERRLSNTRLRKSLLASRWPDVVLLVARSAFEKLCAPAFFRDGLHHEERADPADWLVWRRYNDPAQQVNLYRSLLERVRALPACNPRLVQRFRQAIGRFQLRDWRASAAAGGRHSLPSRASRSRLFAAMAFDPARKKLRSIKAA